MAKNVKGKKKGTGKMSRLIKKGMSPALANYIKTKNAGKSGWGRCK